MIFSMSSVYGENNRWDSLVEKNYIDQTKNVRKDSDIRHKSPTLQNLKFKKRNFLAAKILI